MIRYRSRVSGAVLLLALTACAGHAPAGERRPDRNLISSEDMEQAGTSDAFTAVQSLRPHWLETRGVTTVSLRESVKVYLDGSLLGGPDHLRQINVHTIATIRYLDALEATQRWGLDHGHGAIVVTSRRHSNRS